MKSIRYIILFSLLSIALNGYCQQPTPSSLTQIWVLKSDGEVTSLLEPTPTPTQVPPDLIIDLPGGVTMEFMQIPAGSFLMGSTDDANWSWCIPCEQPMHEVTIGYDFYMGQFEVTQAQWLAMMGSWPYRDPADDNYGHGDNYPAYFISWDDCQNFITELNKLGQGTFRLPSEAEWEYACRAGTTSRFYFGDSVGCATRWQDCAAGVMPGNRSDYMWYSGNMRPYGSKPVGGRLPNNFGLYDMLGNIAECCQDYWHEGYSGAPVDGRAWMSPMDSSRVIRSGAWYTFAAYCRSSFRHKVYPDYRDVFVGFRVVREVE